MPMAYRDVVINVKARRAVTYSQMVPERLVLFTRDRQHLRDSLEKDEDKLDGYQNA